VRLVGGGSHNEGLVEVYYNGKWGTVCHNKWNDRLANLVCVQLGFSSGRSSNFAPGANRIFLGNIICPKNAAILASCGHYGIGITVNCGHYQDVGVKCHGMDFI